MCVYIYIYIYQIYVSRLKTKGSRPERGSPGAMPDATLKTKVVAVLALISVIMSIIVIIIIVTSSSVIMTVRLLL